MSGATLIDTFWNAFAAKAKPTQLERYIAKNAPAGIQRFIALGGGPKMGTTLEAYARHCFPCLHKRKKGRDQTGYDHYIVSSSAHHVLVEQKSSGHWGDADYKWQHLEEKHNWNMLLLCGIDYDQVRFWAMDRATFRRLIEANVITNQGNKAGNSSEGRWFNYMDVKDSLTEIRSNDMLLEFASNLQKVD
jgi:hypothetical protein